MCGIVYIKRLKAMPFTKKEAQKLVIKRYEKQKARGQEGYGFVELIEGVVIAETRTQYEKEALAKLKDSVADEIMFHHRFPTSTPNLIEATHPIKVSHPSLRYNYYVMHNGIISNDYILKEKHNAEGYDYTTEITKQWLTKLNRYEQVMFNDSEALAIDIAQAIESGAPITAEGSIAVVALQYEKETGKAIALYYGRNASNPLGVESSKEFFALSSESGSSIKSDVLYRRDYETGAITEQPKEIGVSYTRTIPMGYTNEEWKKELEAYNTDYPSNTLDEEDFDMTDYEAIIELQEEIQKAYSDGDYDEAQLLEMELDELREAIARATKRKKKGHRRN